jgi:hypothetical protein
MKKTFKSIISVVFALMFVVCMVSCNAADNTDVWENATYREDAEFGSGAKTVAVEVKVGDHKVTFTIKTDKETVGEALAENGLISGDEGPYGLYVKVVNGITADYDVDQSYWSFNINGEYAMTGVDQTEINPDTVYSLVKTKG